MTLGLKDLYYAVCTEADGAESYGTPKKMAEAMSADLSVKTADGSLYADDTLSGKSGLQGNCAGTHRHRGRNDNRRHCSTERSIKAV